MSIWATFQFPPPHGGRHYARWPQGSIDNFNSRPRTGGDGVNYNMATQSCEFQFPPPHGGRQSGNRGLRSPSDFNSRPRTGGDSWCPPAQDRWYISIPAPARGATKSVDRKTRATIFQFPPPHGGRPLNAAKATVSSVFQFPPPHGGRQQKCPNWIGQFYTFMLHSIFPKWQKSSTLLIMPELCA